MPEELERALMAKARAKGRAYAKGKKLTKRGRAYVFGTMRKTGWKPERERSSHGGH